MRFITLTRKHPTSSEDRTVVINVDHIVRMGKALVSGTIIRTVDLEDTTVTQTVNDIIFDIIEAREI